MRVTDRLRIARADDVDEGQRGTAYEHAVLRADGLQIRGRVRHDDGHRQVGVLQGAGPGGGVDGGQQNLVEEQAADGPALVSAVELLHGPLVPLQVAARRM